MSGTTRQVSVQRWSITSRKPFESVMTAVEAAIGKPDMSEFGSRLGAAKTYEEMEMLVQHAVSQVGLMEFLRLDAGSVLAKAQPQVPLFTAQKLLGLQRPLAGEGTMSESWLKFVVIVRTPAL